VGIDIAEIRGRFEGELTARQQLVIRSTGKVTGKIRYGKITIEEGGELVGDVSTLAGPASVRHAEPVIPEPANADIMAAYDPFARKSKPMAKSGGL
jgi:cytoskeletal protein CcmA (bactofilin family)